MFCSPSIQIGLSARCGVCLLLAVCVACVCCILHAVRVFLITLICVFLDQKHGPAALKSAIMVSGKLHTSSHIVKALRCDLR
jgi:hypothetical protein